MSNLASDVMSVASGEVGYSRWSDPEQGTKYGRWYASMTGSSYFGTNGVPYCAMFVSWCFNQAGASAVGLPGAYCPTMLTAGKRAGKAVSCAEARYGDLVYFDWEGDGTSDHVGLVEANYGSYLQTIEGNTGNGQVLRRTRSYSTVSGIIRPDYDGSVATGHTSATEALDVDGWWGTKTVSACQRALGTTVDGYVSGQSAVDMASIGGAPTDAWHIGTGGSEMVSALQTKIGTDVDGYFGSNSCRALQSYLGTTVDGVLSRPSDAVKALQRRLNAGTL